MKAYIIDEVEKWRRDEKQRREEERRRPHLELPCNDVDYEEFTEGDENEENEQGSVIIIEF